MRPPRLACVLLRLLLPPETRAEVLEDLEDLWVDRCRSQGRRSADRWFWSQALGSIAPTVLGKRIDRGREEGEGMFGSFVRDVGYAVTQLRKHPGIGIVVVATLALGIGATTAIFSAVHGVLLKPLPFGEPDRLVMITGQVGGSGLPRFVSGPDFVDMSQGTPSLAGAAGLLETTVGPMTEVDRPAHVVTTPVTWNLLEVLDVEVALGRAFAREDAVPVPADVTESPPGAAIISHDFWQSYFAGDPGVIGTVVHVWGSPSEIVGVLQEGFRLVLPPELNIPPDGDIWHAIRSDMTAWSRGRPRVRTIARLTEGVSLRQTRHDVERFTLELRAAHASHAAEGTSFTVDELAAKVAAPMRAPLWLLMGAVGLVLLIACANVANLLMARGAARTSEMAVRTSLGADGTRLVRQLLTESAVMAGLGAVGGVLLARLGVVFLHTIRPDDLHRLETVRLDLPVLAFTAIVAITATLLAGFLPALQTARTGLARNLSTRGGAGVDGRSRHMLVVTEVALSVMLLIGAGLLIRSFSELQRMPLGFEPDRVLTVTATQSSRTPEERRAYEAELIRASEAVPGVTSAGIVFPLPMNGVYDRSAEYAMDGRQHDPTSWTTAYFRTVSPTYFETIGLEMKAGRSFTEADENYDVPIVVLDERLARREFPGRDPIGQPLWVRGMQGDTLRAEIVGVVEYAPQWDHRDARPTMYFPRVFYQSHEVSVVAKVAADDGAAAAGLSAAVRAVDPAFPADLVPMEHYVRERLARSRFLLVLMQIFGALALGLSAVGLYGVLSYSVRQRHRELGLRLALGAEGSTLTGSVIAAGLRLTGLGLAIGLAGAQALAQALRSQLFRVEPADPWTISATAVLVLAVAASASLLPAARAARVDPMVALQEP